MGSDLINPKKRDKKERQVRRAKKNEKGKLQKFDFLVDFKRNLFTRDKQKKRETKTKTETGDKQEIGDKQAESEKIKLR